ncbi:Poly-beta-1,6-N-acetyl-D-glucosamine N-deacetylase [Anaerolineales bacterium]|nr:Poly-beta-1,6-N-acetyl-D-glucosamine N-deacetylase [Anaerolineales bacterium]
MNRAIILMYHILDSPLSERESKYCCLPERFEEQMAWIGKHFNPIGMDAMLAGLNGEIALPDRAVAVTFDDGFASTFEHAMPVLIRYGIPATMFIVANRFGGDNDWMHTRGMPQRPLMTASQILEMRASGVVIGSHTLNHAKLSECAPEELVNEISGSKAKLEDLLGEPVRHFAYPYGLYNEAARSQVEQAGYASACSTRSGFNGEDADQFLLRRIEVFGADRLWHFKQKLQFGTNDASWHQPFEYYAGRLLARFSKRS